MGISRRSYARAALAITVAVVTCSACTWDTVVARAGLPGTRVAAEISDLSVRGSYLDARVSAGGFRYRLFFPDLPECRELLRQAPGDAVDPREVAPPQPHRVPGEHAVVVEHGLEVPAGGERAAGAGEQDRAHRRVGLGPVESSRLSLARALADDPVKAQPATFAEPFFCGEHCWRYAIPGHGCVRWTALLRLLEGSNYKGSICIELEDANFTGSREAEQLGILLGKRFLEGC